MLITVDSYKSHPKSNTVARFRVSARSTEIMTPTKAVSRISAMAGSAGVAKRQNPVARWRKNKAIPIRKSPPKDQIPGKSNSGVATPTSNHSPNGQIEHRFVPKGDFALEKKGERLVTVSCILT